MAEPAPVPLRPVKPPERRLDSWKEIARYLDRDVKTVQRWEKREGMPVHRHQHDRMGSVYASSSELDAWLQSRRFRFEQQEEVGEELATVVGTGDKSIHISRPRFWLCLVGIAVLAVVAGGYLMRKRATEPKIKSLAVLPLKNLSGDSSQGYLADGITEDLIGRLSMIHDLRVPSRTSVMRFKDAQLSVSEIAKNLGVDAVVEGSVIREGNRIRVHAQLIRAATDEHLWSETYDRELLDVLPLESEVAQAITEKVKVTVPGGERARLVAARQVSPEVYESYLKGRFFDDPTPAGGQTRIRYFEEAIRKDPTFAPAYLSLAEAYDELGTPGIGAVPPKEVRPKMIEFARKALELDPTLAEAHAILADAYQQQWQWSNAESEYKRALELNPNSAEIHLSFASWLMCEGRLEEAVAWARRGRELDPLEVSGQGVGWILFQSRRYDEAIRELRSDLAARPDNPGSQWFLGFALIANGHPEEAVPILERAAALTHRGPAIVGVLIRAYAHSGRRPEALRLLQELKQRQQKGYIPAAAFLNAYLGIDDKEQAFVWLERGYQEQSMIMQYLRVHPYFDPIRKDPRFADLLHRVGLDHDRPDRVRP